MYIPYVLDPAALWSKPRFARWRW